MSKFSNVLKMINILKGAKEPIKRKDIAEQLGVSERMVRKYVEDIEQGGIKIISTSGRYGGLRIEEDPQEQNKKFNLDEIIYLKTIIDLNKKEVIQKIEYLTNEFNLNKDNPTINFLNIQLNNILSIENKLNYLGK